MAQRTQSAPTGQTISTESLQRSASAPEEKTASWNEPEEKTATWNEPEEETATWNIDDAIKISEKYDRRINEAAGKIQKMARNKQATQAAKEELESLKNIPVTCKIGRAHV